MMTRKTSIPLLLVTLAVTSGCVSSRVDTAISDRLEVSSDASVVILARRQDAETETESGFVSCVKKAMLAGENPVMLSSERDFVDQLFPWFEPRVVTLHGAAVESRAAIRRRS